MPAPSVLSLGIGYWRSLCQASLGIALTYVLLTSPVGFAQDSKQATKPAKIPDVVNKVLAQHGLRIVGPNLVLDQDSEVEKDVRKLTDYKKKLRQADSRLNAAEFELEEIKKQVAELRNRRIQLNAQLANVNDVLSNNRIVGQLNATEGLIQTLGDQQKKADENVTEARKDVLDIETDFVETLTELRDRSDKAREKWASLVANEAVLDAIESAANHTGQKIPLKPSKKVEIVEKQLSDFEKSVISELIPLENRDGGYWVDVSINENPVEKMVFDTGASALSISAELAKKLKVEPKPADPDVIVSLADGRQIPGKLVVLEAVRVGKFTVSKVECVVLGEQAKNARPLLGMSFLEKFKFAMNAGNSELKLVQVDSGEGEPSPGKLKKKSK